MEKLVCIAELQGQSQYSPKKIIAAHLHFAKDHMDKPENNWMNVLWMDETKTEHSGLNERYLLVKEKPCLVA